MKTRWTELGASDEGFEWLGPDTNEIESGEVLEATIGEPNFRRIWWLEEAVLAANKVARVRMPNGVATGFLVGENLFMTNHHVFEDEGDAANAKLQFNYRVSRDDSPSKVDEWLCDPDKGWTTNPDLDYSIVAVKKKGTKSAGVVYGFLDISKDLGLEVKQRVNIIQHPKGRYQEIAFRDNQVMAVIDDVVQYLSDTDYGSSGSAVFDDFFNIVALHNQRVEDPKNPGRWYRNQGYLIDKIYENAKGFLKMQV